MSQGQYSALLCLPLPPPLVLHSPHVQKTEFSDPLKIPLQRCSQVLLPSCHEPTNAKPKLYTFMHRKRYTMIFDMNVGIHVALSCDNSSLLAETSVSDT